MLAALRSGSFVTRQRMRVYGILLLVAYVAAIVALLATADGIVDAAGRPLGTDFANVYAAGKLALAGEPGLAYDWPAHHAMQKAISGREDIPYYGWHYPPAFLLVTAALAALPYLGALFVYQAATLASRIWRWCGELRADPRPGCRRWRFRPCSSTSRTDTTASSRRRCWGARCWCSTGGRCWRAR